MTPAPRATAVKDAPTGGAKPPKRTTPAGGSSGPDDPNRRLWSGILIVAGLLALALVLVIWQLPHWLRHDSSVPTTSTAKAEESRRIRATLFYVSDDGSQLVPVDREVQFGNGAAEQGATHHRDADRAGAQWSLAKSAILPGRRRCAACISRKGGSDVQKGCRPESRTFDRAFRRHARRGADGVHDRQRAHD